MEKHLMIIEYYRFDSLISIVITSTLQRKFDNYVDFNIYEDSLLSMKAKAYDYILEKVSNGYTIQNIEKLHINKPKEDI